MNMQHDDPDNLFGDISIDAIEESLITVDVPEDQQQQIEKELTDGEEKPAADAGGEKTTEKPAEKPADTIIVVDEEKPAETAAEIAAKDKKDKGGTPDDKEDESPSYLHAAALREEGVLPNLDLTILKDKKPQEVFQAINEHINSEVKDAIKSGIDQYKDGFGDKAQKFLEYLDKGVPFQDVADSYTMEDRYAGIKDKDLEDDENLQKSVYSDFLGMKGFTAPKIAKMVEKALQDGELSDESKEGLKEITEAIKTDRDNLEAQIERDEAERKVKNDEVKVKIQETVSGMKEIIPGVTISDKERQAIVKNMTVPVRYANRNGRQMPVSKAMDIREKNPVKYEMKLNYFLEKGFFDDDAKFNEIIRKAETSSTKKLLDKMSEETRKAGKTTVTGKEGREKEEKPFIFPEMI